MMEQLDILLVEDDGAQARLVESLLKRSGVDHRLHHAPDGESALDYIFARGTHEQRQTEPLPHLILLDLILPGLDGFGVLDELVKHDDTRDIPVIVLTSASTPENVARCESYGVHSYMIKPVAFIDFVGKLREAADLRMMRARG